jgi:hypothetical protein
MREGVARIIKGVYTVCPYRKRIFRGVDSPDPSSRAIVNIMAALRSSVVPGNRESVNTVLRTSFDPISKGALL